MMSLSKSFFQLTAYMKEDKEFGSFWKLIYQEYVLAKKVLLEEFLIGEEMSYFIISDGINIKKFPFMQN